MIFFKECSISTKIWGKNNCFEPLDSYRETSIQIKMNEQFHALLDTSTLAYRLRKTVQYHETERSLCLVLNYPLKAIAIDPLWKPIIKRLDGDVFIPFKEIVPLIADAVPEKIESYLNSLVRKGFLKSKGFISLAEYPFVSIIIPVRNRPADIEACLQSLSRLDYPDEKKEVIVIDDASDDHTPHIVSKYPVHLIPLKEHRQASFCRNLAAQEAKGEILAFLDSDCLADALWLKELIPAFCDPSTGAVGGLVDSYFDQKGLDRYEKVKSSLNLGTYPRSSREGDRFFYVPSCNLLVRRSLFLKSGGFREDMIVGEDVDLCWRLQDQGFHVEYRPMGRVFHKHRNKIRHFFARRFDYGTSEPLLQRYHSKRIKRLVLPLSQVLFWGLGFLAIGLENVPLLILCGTILFMDSLFRLNRTRRKKIHIPYLCIITAVFREYIAILYQICAFTSRYYIIFGIILVYIVPIVSIVIFGMHILVSFVEYWLKRPRLFFHLFILYFTMDQLSYQLGVWWGCLRKSFFNPINPEIVRKIP